MKFFWLVLLTVVLLGLGITFSQAQETQPDGWPTISQEAIQLYEQGEYDEAREELLAYFRKGVTEYFRSDDEKTIFNIYGWRDLLFWEHIKEKEGRIHTDLISTTDQAALSLYIISPDEQERLTTLARQYPDNWLFKELWAGSLARDSTDEAIKLFEELISQGHGSWWNYYVLGRAYLCQADKQRQGPIYIEINFSTINTGALRPERSIELWEKAVEIKPDKVYIWADLATGYHSRGKFEKAIKCYRKALEIVPKNVELREPLGLALLKTGRLSEGIKELKQADENFFRIFVIVIIAMVVAVLVVLIALFLLIYWLSRRSKRGTSVKKEFGPHPEIKWGLSTALAAIVLSMVLILTSTLIMPVFLPINDTVSILIAIGLANLIVISGLAWLAHRAYGSIRKGFGLDVPMPTSWLWKIPLICIGLYAFSWLYTLVTASLNIEIKSQEIVTMINNLQSPFQIIMVLFMIAVVTPVFEEIIYRACLYNALKKYLGIKKAVIFSAFIFASIHWNLSVLLPLFVVGVALAWMFERSKSLLTSIIAHGFFNLINIVLVLIFGI